MAAALFISLGIPASANEGFAPRIMISEFDSTFAQLADLDGDGDLDVIAANEDENLSWFENTDGLGQSWQMHVIGGLYFSPIAIGDLDKDGDIDIVGRQYIEETSSRILIWWENKVSEASPWSSHLVSGDFESLESLSLADLDKDADLDILISDDDGMTWFENPNSEASPWTRHSIENAAPGNGTMVDTADLDGDGDLDVISRISTGHVYWHENQNGLGTLWGHTATPGTGIELYGTAYVDLDEDGDTDIVVGDRGSPNGRTVFWLENAKGDGSIWTEHDLPVPLVKFPTTIAATIFPAQTSTTMAISML